jgi:hypothetical protein
MSAPSPQKRRETAKAIIREFGISVDGRSREAKALRRFRAQLIQHIGGSPSVAQEAMIQSICQLRLRLLALDQSFARRGTMTETESRHYRGWTSTYHAALKEIGPDAVPTFSPMALHWPRTRSRCYRMQSGTRVGLELSLRSRSMRLSADPMKTA